jgi:hypothetical protein
VFQELKRYLTSPSATEAPEHGEPLLLYITTTAEAVSLKRQRRPLWTVQVPKIRNQQGAVMLGLSPGPSSRRRP